MLGAQVGEGGLLLGQQAPDDDQDGSAGGNNGFLLTAAPGDPAVALPEEGLGVRRADRGLAQDPGQVGVAVSGGAGAVLLVGGFPATGGEPRPRGEMRGAREPAQVQTD